MKPPQISTTILSGGVQDIAEEGGAGTAVSTTIAGGAQIVGDGGGFFGAPGTAGGTLQIGSTAMPTNVISGLAIGDVIDLLGVTFSSGGSATLMSGNVLKVVDGGKAYQLHLDPKQVLTADAFTLSADSATGTKIIVSPNLAPPVVLSATSPQSGAYGVGRTVTFTLNMNLPVNVSGTPTLTLNDGGTASYVSGSGTSKLTFSSTIGAGQNAAQLTTSLSTLSGGTLDGITGTPVSASTTAIKLGTLGANTTMVPGSTVKLSANTEAALQAAINIAASGETIDPAGITISAPLIIPTGTNVIIDGFGDGTGSGLAHDLARKWRWPSARMWLRLRAAAGGNWTPDGILQLEGEANFSLSWGT